MQKNQNQPTEKTHTQQTTTNHTDIYLHLYYSVIVRRSILRKHNSDIKTNTIKSWKSWHVFLKQLEQQPVSQQQRVEFLFTVLEQIWELRTCKPWILFNLFYMDSRNISSNHFFLPWAAVIHFFPYFFLFIL